MSYDDHTYQNSTKDFPKGEHFVILEFDSIYIPGDERSRTHPGHGYPEHSEDTVKYIIFKTREAWEAEIKKRVTENPIYRKDNWVPLISRKVEIDVKVNVKVEIG